jgi:hypothetical protein
MRIWDLGGYIPGVQATFMVKMMGKYGERYLFENATLGGHFFGASLW